MVGPYVDPPFPFDVTTGFDPAGTTTPVGVPLEQLQHPHQPAFASVPSARVENGLGSGPAPADGTGQLRFATAYGHSAKMPPPPIPPRSPLDMGPIPGQIDLSIADLLMDGVVPWGGDALASARAAEKEEGLRRELRRALEQRDEARLAVAGLRNEVYAALQVEKRLRAERDDARGQIAFLKKERAAGRLTEQRLRKERSQARMGMMLARRHGKRSGRSKGFGEIPGPLEPLITGDADDGLAEWVAGQQDAIGVVDVISGMVPEPGASPPLYSPTGDSFASDEE